MKQVLVTGATGFVGSWLIDYILANHSEIDLIVCAKRRRSDETNIKHLLHNPKVKYLDVNLEDSKSVDNIFLVHGKFDRCFHLAAQSFVKLSFDSPSETLTTNIFGTLNLLEAFRKYNKECVIQIAGCYDTNTKAFTRDGFKSYKDLKIGQEVLSINPDTREVSFKKIKKVIIDKYKGKMIKFKSRSLDLMVTPNHRMLVSKNKNSKINIQYAENIKGRNLIPLGKTNSKKNDFSNEEAYLLGVFIGDGCLIERTKKIMTSGISREKRMQYREVNGNFTFTPEKSFEKAYKHFSVSLSIPKTDKSYEKIKKCLLKLGYPINYSGIEFNFTPNEKMLRLFKLCGKYANNKTIPEELLEQNIEILKSLFNGLIDSDGNYRKNSYGFTTISDILKDKMIELCHKIGLNITINKSLTRESKLKTGRIIKNNGCWNINISNGEKILTKTSADNEIIDYNDTIWCVEVEDNGTLLVERNGKICFCGNSSEEYGEQIVTPIKEDAPLNPLSPYAVSKVTQEKMGYQYYKSYGLKTILTRTFNHEGPRRGEMFVTSSFAKQIAEIEKGLIEPVISHGNLDSYRDYTDVRDVVYAYWLATEKCAYGEAYNICSGNSIKIEDMLNYMLEQSTRKDIKNVLDPNKLRPSDLIKLEGSNAKFCEATGWAPTITVWQMFTDILNYWRERV